MPGEDAPAAENFFKCVRQWPAGSRFDSDDDLRNNMVGDRHAAAILVANVLAESVLYGDIDDETYVEILHLHYTDTPEGNFWRELELLKRAPHCTAPCTVFPPPQMDMSVLHEDREL